jgi:hypothetical protein
MVLAEQLMHGSQLSTGAIALLGKSAYLSATKQVTSTPKTKSLRASALFKVYLLYRFGAVNRAECRPQLRLEGNEVLEHRRYEWR